MRALILSPTVQEEIKSLVEHSEKNIIVVSSEKHSYPAPLMNWVNWLHYNHDGKQSSLILHKKIK